MIFLTDLDNTLIFSYKKLSEDNLCVEKKDNKNLSYMTYYSAELFKRIVGEIPLIPVTTRSEEQYRRIVFPDKFQPKYAVIDNGANLLIDGVPDRLWKRELEETIEGSLPEIGECEKYLEKCQDRYFDIRLADGAFLFTKCHSSDKIAEELRLAVNPTSTKIYTNGDKLYVIPDGISKKNALERLKVRLKDDYVIAAGDSLFDEGMLSAANLAIIKYGELTEKEINPNQISEKRENNPDFVLSCLWNIILGKNSP